MGKFISSVGIVLALLVVLLMPSSAVAAGGGVTCTVSAYLPGDANGDTIVDTGDITKVKRIYFGVDAPTPGADANDDGKVDTGDITAIKAIYFGAPG